MYPMHSEAKQPKMPESEAEEGLLQDPVRRRGWLVPKPSELPEGFQGEVLKAKLGVRAAECVTFFRLASGELQTLI